MSHPVLVTGAAGGRQGSTGRVVTGRNPQTLEKFFRENTEVFAGTPREA
jgi:hypothetical protein